MTPRITRAVFVPVNVLYRAREIAHILSDAEPVLFVIDTAAGEDAAPGQACVSLPVLAAEAAAAPDAPVRKRLDGDAPAVTVAAGRSPVVSENWGLK